MEKIITEENIPDTERENTYRSKEDFLYSKLLIVAILVGLVQMGISIYDNYSNKDFMHVNRMLSLDSIQVQQNNMIIKLLEKQPIRDTVVVHIVAPVE